jgi:putative flippase GtrA
VTASHIDHLLERMERRPLLGRVGRFYQRRREQILYLVVGGWNTLFGYLVWALLQYLLHDYIYYLVILVLAWFPAVLNAYVCYRYIVFRSRAKIRWELPRFSVVYVVMLCVNLVTLPILLRVLPFSIYATQIVFTIIVVILSYLSHKYFSFRSVVPRAVLPQDGTRAADESKDTTSSEGRES